MEMTKANLVKQTEEFITKYATLAEDYYKLPCALWAIATHTWPSFDTFPYLVITGYTKRCGKTRLMELLGMVSSNSQTFSPDSPSAMFRSFERDPETGVVSAPTMFLDEAEKLNKEDHPARELLNKGYRKGQYITRVVGGKPYQFESYCPKCFVLIGDVYDTLKDRAMIVVMRRRTPIEAATENKFRMDAVMMEARELRETIHDEVEEHQADIDALYAEGMTLDFLNDRDEEIWQALFTICQIFAPNRIQELTRCAVDMSTEKQAPSRKSYGVEWKQAEEAADNAEARIFLLKDMLTLSKGKTHLPTTQLLDELKAIPTSQWRRYKGVGLIPREMGMLLDGLGIHPKTIRVSKSHKVGTKSTVKGYKREDLEQAAKNAGLEF